MAEQSFSGPVDAAGRPAIERLGTIECDLVECTPVVFNDRVYRCEWVRTLLGQPGRHRASGRSRISRHTGAVFTGMVVR